MLTQYRNARLVSLRHEHEFDRLILGFEQLPDWQVDSVVDFSLSGFFTQNIVFDIREYDMHSLPPKIAAEFPVLSYYLHSGENWQVFHLSPQAGLGGIIVCAVLDF